MNKHLEDGTGAIDRLHRMLEEQHGKESFNRALDEARKRREKLDSRRKLENSDIVLALVISVFVALFIVTVILI